MDRQDVRVAAKDAGDKQTISVAALGLEERSRSILNNALQKCSDGICMLGDVSDVPEARIAILDLDTKGAEKLFNKFSQAYPDKAIIGIGRQQADLALQAFVAKPLNPEQLLTTIVELAELELSRTKNMITEDKVAKAMKALESKGIAQSLHKRAEQSQPKTVATRAMPSKTDEMCFDPERFLLGSLLKALDQATTNQQIAVLTCWNDRTIIVDPAQSRISSNLSDSQIRSLAIAPIDDNLSSPIHTKLYKAGDVNSELDAVLKTKDLRHFSQESFMWNLGMLTCRGRIPAEFTVSNRHFLRRWPNLTRMKVPANAMRILAYWSVQPCSLMDIKEQLDIPLQEIFTVFSAAYAAGLTGEAKRQADQIMETVEVNASKKRGLMNSIINRLRGDKTKQLSQTA